jgi:hypothetical protein
MLNIAIHNLHPGLELTSPVYFSTGTTCYVSPSQQTDIGAAIKASFGIGFKQEEFRGALLYKLQRKYANRTNNPPNSCTTPVKDTTTNIYLLVLWNIPDIGYHHSSCACLLECTDDLIWDEDKLWALHHQYNDQFYKNYESRIIPWLMNDGMVIKTAPDIAYGPDCKLDVVVSEGTGKYNMYKPMKIDSERLVSLLLMLITLTCAVSLYIGSLFKLNIHNQCLNVDLASPIYVTGVELECCRLPKYKVCAGDIMKSAFIIKSDDVPVGGALICNLQRKHTNESVEFGEDTSSTVRLLVVWGTFESKYDADVLLVESDKEFNWEKGGLIDLYNKNSSRFRWFRLSATETWSLDDNTTLMIAFEIINEDRILNIIINEVGRDNNTRAPSHIDLERQVIL